jgi:putative transposase
MLSYKRFQKAVGAGPPRRPEFDAGGIAMSGDTSKTGLRSWAHLRFSIIGGLLAAPPPSGELRPALEELASRQWQHPDNGRPVAFGVSTIERWYYRARDAPDPIAALTRRVRVDAGRDRVMSATLVKALHDQYRNHRSWSYQLHADNLVALVEQRPELGAAPSYSTLRRRMHTRGWLPRRLPRRPTPGQRRAAERLDKWEVRSFESSFVHGLWHYDFHEGRRRVVDDRGGWHTPFAFAVMDDCSRLCCHMQWYLAEKAENLIHGLEQGFHKRGLPRSTLHDRGGAMLATETLNGLGELGVISRPTLGYSPYQNGKQEKFWDQVEGRLMALVEKVDPLRLDFLNRATQAWVEREYNRTKHDELDTSPLDRLLEGPDVSRPAPDAETLRRAFSLQQTRTQRRSDGTISVEGVRFELPSRLRVLRRVTIRYQSWDLSCAWVVDPGTATVLARIHPLDKRKNADGRRRVLATIDDVDHNLATDGTDEPIPALMRKYLEEYAATGLPPAYLPKDELLLAAAALDEPNDTGERR